MAILLYMCPQVSSYYCMCPQALGQLNEAATHYRRAVELRPDRGFMVNLAFVLGARGDTAASIDAVLNLLALLVQKYKY